MKVVFRDLNSSGVVDAVKALLPEWDAAVGDIFASGQPVDIIVSPANVTGRMDGGIDQIYINRFGWQLEHRLMRDIKAIHGGCLRIGAAHLITTYDERVDAIPLMISAPTMTVPATVRPAPRASPRMASIRCWQPCSEPARSSST